MKSFHWRVRNRVIELGVRPLVMGIVNVTPDSFSDGGQYLDHTAAVERGLQLVAEGADILDIGGESTRPGAKPVTVNDELQRVCAVVAELVHHTRALISIDTQKAEVARACLDRGAHIINDIGGFRDSAMVHAAAQHGAGIIVMHMQGTPQTMQVEPCYGDVVQEVATFFEERLRPLRQSGISAESICLDPGIGFGKTLDHNLSLLANLAAFSKYNCPICLGVSRKGMIGTICGREKHDRMAGSLAIAACAAARGEAQILRVHDVAPTRDAALLLEAIAQHRN